MNSDSFYHKISISSAHRESRERNSDAILKQPENFPNLIAIAFDLSDKNHHKACWILELVLEKQLDWMDPYLEKFCNTLPEYQHDGAVRSISKICWFLMIKHLTQTLNNNIFLTKKQTKIITEVCFDWIIGDTKVASKVYAMRALFEMGKLDSWVYPEMQSILEKDFSLHTAAYRSAAKDILKRLK